MSLSTAATLSGWRWRQYGKDEEWHKCAHDDPTTEIFTDLLDAKRIPDPFLDQNELSLGSQTLASNRTTELLEDLSVDQTTAIHALMLDNKDIRVIARASDWPQPLKHVNLPTSPNVTVSVLDGKVEIRADAPVKGVEVYMADDERNVSWDDNGVDVFPDDVYTIYAKGLVKGDGVRVRYYGAAF